MENTFDHLLFNNKKLKSTREKHMSLPQITPMSITTGIGLFAGIGLIGASIGATIGTYVFFGTVMLTGLIVVIENNKYLKYVAVRSNSMIDILIFTATIAATAQLGITITAALTFCGLGYTLVYSPYLRGLQEGTYK